MNLFKEILNKKVERVLLIVWPPFGEDNALDIDISLGLIFHNEIKLHVISTDDEDRWTPKICIEDVPENIFLWNLFEKRMKRWMDSEEIGVFDYEYYDVTNSNLFDNINNNKIQSIDYLRVGKITDPFGVKLIFENDYILSTPTSDGNTIETNFFNKNENIINFEEFGELALQSL